MRRSALVLAAVAGVVCVLFVAALAVMVVRSTGLPSAGHPEGPGGGLRVECSVGEDVRTVVSGVGLWWRAALVIALGGATGLVVARCRRREGHDASLLATSAALEDRQAEGWRREIASAAELDAAALARVFEEWCRERPVC